ncbi:hypothetical protein DCAR_0312533 [Daucus carota subsp. sativus]|uniref:UDP-glycosyltransferase n=1 Tax=Daucus carota subsp. sativus TaxID=79200 RepID=A0AAF0WP60_DAUCS|nr:hypothetical protein DCAR_0312533 [Daucus carota subsp. sativus]
MGIPHVLAIPYPAQGHVIPMMELLRSFTKQGGYDTYDLNSRWTGPSEDRNDFVIALKAMFEVMPGKLEELIEKINETDDNKITCLVADENMGWAFKVAEKFGIKKVGFWPASTALLAANFNVPKLIQDEILNSDGKCDIPQIRGSRSGATCK